MLFQEEPCGSVLRRLAVLPLLIAIVILDRDNKIIKKSHLKLHTTLQKLHFIPFGRQA